jgi:hypothetical protein
MSARDAEPLIPMLSRDLFWDTDQDQLDPETHAEYIVSRVMDHGSWEDVQAISIYYGPDRIRKVLLEAPSLHRRTICLFALAYHLPLESFKAYRKLQACSTWER